MVCKCVSLRSLLAGGLLEFGYRIENLFRAATAGELVCPLPDWKEVCLTVRKGELGSFPERFGENAP